MVRKYLVDFFVKPNVVTHVGEQGMTSPYPTGKSHGIVHKLMGMVGTVEAQGVDHQRVDPLKQGQLVVVNGLHVSDIGKSTKAIAHNGQLTVHHPDRQNVNITNAERLSCLYAMQPNGRHARIAVLCKAIREHLEHALASQFIGIDIDFSKLAIGPHVVHTAHVIIVGMGNKDAVNTAERLRKDLFTKIGATVNEQACLLCLNKDGASQTPVMRMAAPAHRTLAAYDGHTT